MEEDWRILWLAEKGKLKYVNLSYYVNTIFADLDLP